MSMPCHAAQSFLTPYDPMDCSLPGSSVHRIFQARRLEWVAISFSKITRRNIDNLRYANVNILMAESEKELKNLLMRVKEESKKSVLNLAKLIQLCKV